MPELPPALRRPLPADHPGLADGEPVADHRIGQPVSAAASVAYLAAGAELWRRRATGEDPFGAACFALAVAANGIGGIAYHGPGDRVSRWLHDAALCATLGVQAARTPGVPSTAASIGAAVAPGVIAVAVAPRLTNGVVTVLGGVALLRDLANTRRGWRPGPGPAAVAVAATAAGLALHRLARPDSRAHLPGLARFGHGGWHVLSAVGLTAWGYLHDRPDPTPAGGRRTPTVQARS